MNDKMAFRASYADWKLIKTRGVVSISFEVPLNESHLAYEALGGMPVAAKEIWCGIARLKEDDGLGTSSQLTRLKNEVGTNQGGGHVTEVKISQPRQEPSTPDGAKTRTAFRDMRPANQAGILCATIPFLKFLSERLRVDAIMTQDEAADYVRRHCNVASRKDIRPRTPSGDRWQKLFDEYKVWMNAPELVA